MEFIRFKYSWNTSPRFFLSSLISGGTHTFPLWFRAEYVHSLFSRIPLDQLVLIIHAFRRGSERNEGDLVSGVKMKAKSRTMISFWFVFLFNTPLWRWTLISYGNSWTLCRYSIYYPGLAGLSWPCSPPFTPRILCSVAFCDYQDQTSLYASYKWSKCSFSDCLIKFYTV